MESYHLGNKEKERILSKSRKHSKMILECSKEKLGYKLWKTAHEIQVKVIRKLASTLAVFR
jgi:hypothetical protein